MVFSVKLSEEEEFDRNLEELPKMGFEDFKKAMKSDKVNFLTSKEATISTYANDYRDFVVDLKEIPGEKSLHRTKWAMRLYENESSNTFGGVYRVHFYEIERQMASSVGKIARVPSSSGIFHI
ncbi:METALLOPROTEASE M41 FTSH [Salix koriyanagi]|uniref:METALLOPROTEASE M41 FTSH n=1 Tax=Salix koriyanagi TaxID=2511006 RepID=A0A9Q0Q865_9ROSI|nr:METALLOPROTEASE M41 FTSH [Salix koriyanagi]